jgi:hypothetical protein
VGNSSTRNSGKSSKSAVKSFSEYKKLKGSEWLKKVKVKENEKAEEVVIFIGLIQWREKERKLVAARGKRVALRISNKAPYADVRSKGIEKWKAYHSNEFDEEYSLVYQDARKLFFCQERRSFLLQRDTRRRVGKIIKELLCISAVIMIFRKMRKMSF